MWLAAASGVSSSLVIQVVDWRAGPGGVRVTPRVTHDPRRHNHPYQGVGNDAAAESVSQLWAKPSRCESVRGREEEEEEG